MSQDPLSLSKVDLDKIIAYQRRQRAAREGGARTKKATGEAPTVDIKALLNATVVKSVSVPAALTLPKTSETPVQTSKTGLIRRF
jgi:hypothetical protein